MAMILQFYGHNPSQNYLRDLLQSNKNGSNAFYMIEAFKKLGFEAVGVKGSLEDLKEHKTILPCIAHVVINQSMQHYLVIYHIDWKNHTMIVADPATKQKRILITNFKEIWTGILLTMYMVEKVEIPQTNISLNQLFVIFILKNKKDFLKALILSIFILTFTILLSFFIQFIIESVTYFSLFYLWAVGIGFACLYVLKIMSTYFRNQLLIYINHKIDAVLTLDTFHKVLELPYRFYRNRTTGEIVSRMYELGLIKQTLGKYFFLLMIDLPFVIVILVLIYIFYFKLWFYTVVIILLFLLIQFCFRNVFMKSISIIQEKKSKYTSYMVEMLQGFETIKGFSMEKIVSNRFEKQYIQYTKGMMKLETLGNRQYVLKELVQNLGYVFLMTYACYFMMNGQMTTGMILTFGSLFMYLLEPIRGLVDFDMELKETKLAINRVFDLWKEEEKTGYLNKTILGNIKIDNMEYENGMSHKEMKIDIKAGEKVMITGESGSGKSTLFHVLKGYENCKRNGIWLDEIEINDYDKNCLKESIRLISQNEILFTGTLSYNLQMEKENSERVDIISKLCCLTSIINRSSLGYHMFLEENGFNLSGGEKQRIILARSLMKPFDILLIDEGTNQIDPPLERTIFKNLFEYYADKTIVVISHRLDNKDLFNQVISFDQWERKYVF